MTKRGKVVSSFKPTCGYVLTTILAQDPIEKRESGLLLSKTTAEETVVRCRVTCINSINKNDVAVGDEVVIRKEDASLTLVLDGHASAIIPINKILGTLISGDQHER